VSPPVLVTENTLDQVLDNAPCGFVSFDDNGRIFQINATLLRRLGYEHPGEVERFETLLAVGTRIFYQTHFFPLVKLHGRAQEVFLLFRTRGGDDVGMLCNAVRRERNGTQLIDCVLMEVEERRKFEEALLEARRAADRANEDLEKQRQAADEANQAKSTFLAVMSHELRTPLNAIGGYVQLLAMGIHGPITEEQKVALERVDRSQRHLLRLINDVLNLSRIEAGRVDYLVEKVVLTDVLSNTFPMIGPQIAAKNLKFTSDVPNDLAARGDREKVQQILLNLLTNAMKFTPAEGTVRVNGGTTGSGQIFLNVADSGIGIPPAMVDRIFEPFIQVDARHTNRSEGTGLGLAISRDLARGMGGDLRLRSEEGKGSVFTLSLPPA
jgi:signal transduction histidine kinase